ncbi:MAG: hypothetical protein ACRDK2_14075 [Solirubrobacteraceae bacterium]
MPGWRPSKKFSAAGFLLLIVIFASLWTSGASASPEADATNIAISGETGETEEESASSNESQPEENEVAEGSEEAQTEAGGEEVTHHHRKHSTQCVVPSVRGNTLSSARHALLAAHCSLGRVYAPHSDHGSLVVSWQSHLSGSHLTRGSSVSLRLALHSRHH